VSTRARSRALRWSLPLLVLGVAVARVGSGPPMPPLGEGDAEARKRVVRAVRDAEPGFRRDSFERFPGDPWSQADQFAAQERELVERLSGEEKMRPGAIFDAIDQDIKRAGARERGRVPPCMPRPFYD